MKFRIHLSILASIVSSAATYITAFALDKTLYNKYPKYAFYLSYFISLIVGFIVDAFAQSVAMGYGLIDWKKFLKYAVVAIISIVLAMVIFSVYLMLYEKSTKFKYGQSLNEKQMKKQQWVNFGLRFASLATVFIFFKYVALSKWIFPKIEKIKDFVTEPGYTEELILLKDKIIQSH